MAIALNGKTLSTGAMEGKVLSESWLNGYMIYPFFRYGTWTNMGTFTSSTREDFGYDSESNVVYLFGGASGYTASSVSSVICKYIASSNTFTTLTTALSGRQVRSCQMVNNTVNGGSYVILGGMPTTGAATDVVNYTSRLLISNLSVSAMVGMPTAKQVFGAAMIYPGGAIHTFGGYYTGFLSEHRIFNQSSNTWSTSTALPAALNALWCVSDNNGKIYIIGGQTSGGAQSTFRCWNVASSTYTTLASLPEARKQHRAIYDPVKKILYVIGGENSSSKATNTVYEYHVNKSKWYVNTSIPTTLSLHGLHRDPLGNIYTIFGRNASRSPVSNIYKFKP